MNAEEGVSLAKMAVTVLLVVLIIGAVVAIVYAAYSWFTSGSDKLTDQVVSIDKSSFSQYDDQTVSGTDVLSALKSYRESEIAIFVANNKVQGTSGYSSATTTLSNVPNYCALASDAWDGTSGTALNSDTDTAGIKVPAAALKVNNGQWEISGTLKWKDNQVVRNTNFSPTTTNAAQKTYVKSSAKWYSNLVYDPSTGEICGILFRQMK